MIDYFESFSDWYYRTSPSDLSTIEEAWSADAVPEKRSKPVELFLGRLQPPHLGHLKIIKAMKNPIVVLVKGKLSSADKKRNPLDTKYQTVLLRKMIPGLRVIVATNGYLPEIISSLREATNNEVVKVYAGEDRIAGYKKQLDSINKKLDKNKQFMVDFIKTKRYTSATQVRDSIKADDEAKFKTMMPKEVWDEWDKLRGLIK